MQVFSKKNNFNCHPYLILVLCLYFLIIWSVNLGIAPGLHGDEAWSGLKANEISKVGIHNLNGMNYYTGMLQALVADLSFKIFGLGIIQLRIPSVVFNCIGLLVLGFTFIKKKQRNWFIFFLIILSQSSLYVLSPRIAWEVNTFTLFLFSILFLSLWELLQKKEAENKFWTIIFFLVNVIGTYNHLIFSSISVSCFAALLFWTLYHRSSSHKALLIILAINFVNMLCLFLAMRYAFDHFNTVTNFTLPFIIILVMYLEVLLFRKVVLWDIKINLLKIPQLVIKGVLTLSLLMFSIFHGRAFIEVLSAYKLFLQVYSYEISPVFQITMLSCSAVFIFYLGVFMYKDFNNNSHSIIVFLIMSYCGVLNLYTLTSSFRYYLIIYIIIAFYLSYNVSKDPLKSIPLLLSFFIAFIVISYIQIAVLSTSTRPMRATKFYIGNDQIETSEHFLPKESLIDFLKKNKTGILEDFTDNHFFIEKPVEFYYLIDPWEQKTENKAIVKYDFTNPGTGFILQIKKNGD